MKLVTVPEMLAIEKEADASGLTYAQMMENAGHNLAKEILSLPYGKVDDPEALALVGPGNNGGDALVALAYLAANGWRVRAYLVKRLVKGDDLVARVSAAGGEILSAEDDPDFGQLDAFIGTATILLDGLLGTGIRLPVKAEAAKVLAAAKDSILSLDWPPYIVAVDCPSGVDSDSGAADECVIPADMTVTMAAVKHGLLNLPAFDLLGELRVAGIGDLSELATWKSVKNLVADEALAASILPERVSDAHKGTFGTAMLAAGSVNYTGAALLAGEAAYRIGTGLVTLAVPAPLHAALAGQLPEATWVLLPHELGVIAGPAAEVLAKNLERATALLLGPGFGTEDATREFVENLLTGKSAPKKSAARIGFVHEAQEKGTGKTFELPPLVVDADGLKLLAKLENWPGLLPAPAVLTPHPGEMAILTGLAKDEIQADRLGTALRFAKEWGHVVVLKGAFTVVAAPDGRTATVPVASSALARAGTGDVLAGLIVGLRAQGVEAFESALAGAWIHAQAGLYAADRLGGTASVLAGDVLAHVSEVLSDIGE
jgi:NAD(P)H-hydrate epimerase